MKRISVVSKFLALFMASVLALPAPRRIVALPLAPATPPACDRGGQVLAAGNGAASSCRSHALRPTLEGTAEPEIAAGLEEPETPDERALFQYVVDHASDSPLWQQADGIRRKNLDRAASGRDGGQVSQIAGAMNERRRETYAVPDALLAGQGAWVSSDGMLYLGETALREAPLSPLRFAIKDDHLDKIQQWAREQSAHAGAASRTRGNAGVLAGGQSEHGTVPPLKPLTAAPPASASAKVASPPSSLSPLEIARLKGKIPQQLWDSQGRGWLFLDAQGRPVEFSNPQRPEEWARIHGFVEHLAAVHPSVSGFPKLIHLLDLDGKRQATAEDAEEMGRPPPIVSIATAKNDGSIRIFRPTAATSEEFARLDQVCATRRKEAEPVMAVFRDLLVPLKGADVNRLLRPVRARADRQGRAKINVAMVQNQHESQEFTAMLRRGAQNLQQRVEEALTRAMPAEAAEAIALLRKRFGEDFAQLTMAKDPKQIYNRLLELTEQVSDWVDEWLAARLIQDPQLFQRFEVEGLTDPSDPSLVPIERTGAQAPEIEVEDVVRITERLLAERSAEQAGSSGRKWNADELEVFRLDWMETAYALVLENFARHKPEDKLIRPVDFIKAFESWKKKPPTERAEGEIARLGKTDVKSAEPVTAAVERARRFQATLPADAAAPLAAAIQALEQRRQAWRRMRAEELASGLSALVEAGLKDRPDLLTAEAIAPLMERLNQAAATPEMAEFPSAVQVFRDYQAYARQRVAEAQREQGMTTGQMEARKQAQAILGTAESDPMRDEERLVFDFLESVAKTGTYDPDKTARVLRRAQAQSRTGDPVRNRFFSAVAALAPKVASAGPAKAGLEEIQRMSLAEFERSGRFPLTPAHYAQLEAAKKRRAMTAVITPIPASLPLYVQGEGLFRVVQNQLRRPVGVRWEPFRIAEVRDWQPLGFILEDAILGMSAPNPLRLPVRRIWAADVPKLNPLQLLAQIFRDRLRVAESDHVGQLLVADSQGTYLVILSRAA